MENSDGKKQGFRNTRAARSGPLTDLPPFVYGTTRLGDEKIPLEDRIAIARSAADAGLWFHTSHTYGDALAVIRSALDRNPSRVPKFIIKLIGDSMNGIRDVLRDNLNALGQESLDLGQLCPGGKLAEEMAAGGPCYNELRLLKKEGLVRRFVLEVFPWTSGVALSALRGGYTRGVVDGYILYLNPLQRFASNDLWDLLAERNEPVIALRTVCGAPVHALRDVPGAAWKDYLRQRAVQVAPIFERSGIASWVEFCVRFAFSCPNVRATVGSTARLENLHRFMSAAGNLLPLPPALVEELAGLHHRWSAETDVQAEPWSM